MDGEKYTNNLKELLSLINKNENDWLKSEQTRFCSACAGGMIKGLVYKSPDAHRAAQLVRALSTEVIHD